MARKLAHLEDSNSEPSSNGEDDPDKVLLNRREYTLLGASTITALGLGAGAVSVSATSETDAFSTGFSEYVQ